MLIQVLCACMCPLAASAWFPRWLIHGSSMRDFALVPGESVFIQLFLGVLTCYDVFADLLKSSVIPCARVHVSDVSIWLSSLSGSPVQVLFPWQVSPVLLALLMHL